MKCKNNYYDHEVTQVEANRYAGYCLACANAGVPDLHATLTLISKHVNDIKQWIHDPTVEPPVQAPQQ